MQLANFIGDLIMIFTYINSLLQHSSVVFALFLRSLLRYIRLGVCLLSVFGVLIGIFFFDVVES